MGILLIIKKPMTIQFNRFKYSFDKIENSNSKNINTGNKIRPAAAGEGIPVKYSLWSIGLLVI